MQRRDPSQLLEFLSERTGLAKDAIPAAGAWAGSGNTIGSIALRMGLLSLEQIEAIVDLQVAGDSRFGDVAVELGYLHRKQVDELVVVQEVHRCIDLGGPLVLSGDLMMANLIRLLADYFD